MKPHIHFFFRKTGAGTLTFGLCKHCDAVACPDCRGQGRVPSEMGCFGPKSWKRCDTCDGRGSYPSLASAMWRTWWRKYGWWENFSKRLLSAPAATPTEKGRTR